MKRPSTVPVVTDLTVNRSTYSRTVRDPRKLSACRSDQSSQDCPHHQGRGSGGSSSLKKGKSDQSSQDCPHHQGRGSSGSSSLKKGSDCHKMKRPRCLTSTNTSTTPTPRSKTTVDSEDALRLHSPLEHDAAVHWPDSQRESPTLFDYDIPNMNACFPSPPRTVLPQYGSNWRPHGGQRERIAHSKLTTKK